MATLADRLGTFLTEPAWADRPGVTPQDIERRRQYAEALLGRGISSDPVESLPEGLSRLTDAIFGGLAMRRAENAANNAEAGRVNTLRETAQQLFGGGGGGGMAQPTSYAVTPQSHWQELEGDLRGLDDMQVYRDAIASVESAGSGDYGALGPVVGNGDRAYGRYQVMGANVGPWTEQALGHAMTPDEFLADPGAQDAVFDYIFGGYVQDYGPEGAARAWFTGSPTGTASDGYINADEYVRRFNAGGGGGGGQSQSIYPVVDSLLNDPATVPLAEQLILQQLQAMAAGPAAAGDPFTLGPGETRYDANGNPIAAVPDQPEMYGPVVTGDQAAQQGLDPSKTWQQGPDQRWYEVGDNPLVVINGGSEVPEGFKAVDSTFASDVYVPWISGGFADVEKNIDQLRGVLNTINEGENITGPLIGVTPEFFLNIFNPGAVDARNQVEEVVQRNLRLILGAQFTQQEGERLISRAFNASLDDTVNARRLAALIQQMERAAQARQAAVDYFRENGTLWGFDGQMPTVADFDAAMDAVSGGSVAPVGGSTPAGSPPMPALGEWIDLGDGRRIRQISP